VSVDDSAGTSQAAEPARLPGYMLTTYDECWQANGPAQLNWQLLAGNWASN